MQIRFERRHRRKGKSMFWGILFITIGLIMLINYTLGINLPILRIVLSVGIIYLGVRLLFGSFGMDVKKVSNARQAIFTESQFSWDDNTRGKDFETVFGQSTLDLTTVEVGPDSPEIKLDTVFGKTTLIIKPGTAFRIDSEAFLGSVKMNGKKLSGLGENTFTSDNFDASKPHLKIKATAVFGEIEVK